MYRCDRNGVTKQAELVEENKKAKTVTLQLEDGTFKAVSESTFKRWWKPVEDETETADAPQEEATQQEEVQTDDVQQDDDVAGDGTSYTEVMQDIVAGAEKKAEDAKKASKKADKKEKAEKTAKAADKPKTKKEKKAVESFDAEPFKKSAVAIGNKLGFTEKLYEKSPNLIVFKLDGKGKAEVRVSRKGYVINVKEEFIGDGVEYKTINNYYLPAALVYDGFDGFDKEIERVLKLVSKWYTTSKKEVTKKKKEKEVA